MKNSNWIIIITLIAIGAGFHALHDVKERPLAGDGVNQILADDDYAPYVKSEETKRAEDAQARKNRRARPRRIQPTTLMNEAKEEESGSTDFGAPPASPAQPGSGEDTTASDNEKESEDQACAEGDEECEEALAKQEQEESEDDLPPSAENSDSEEEELADEQDDQIEAGGPGFVTGPGGQAAAPNNQEEETPQDELVQYWLDRLSRQVNFKLANELAGLVKTNQIESSVYFAVVDELIADPRENIQMVGAYLLGSYQSPQSFERLVAIEPLAPFGSRLNKQVEGYINAYKKLTNIQFLSTVLNTGTNISVIRKAINLVGEAAQGQLSSGVNTQDTDVSQLSNSDANIFRSFLVVLEDLANSIGDQQTAQQASETLVQLQRIIPEETEDAPGNVAENSNLGTNS